MQVQLLRQVSTVVEFPSLQSAACVACSHSAPHVALLQVLVTAVGPAAQESAASLHAEVKACLKSLVKGLLSGLLAHVLISAVLLPAQLTGVPAWQVPRTHISWPLQYKPSLQSSLATHSAMHGSSLSNEF